MFKTKKDYNKTEMRTLIELLYGSMAIKELALSSKIFLFPVLYQDQNDLKSLHLAKKVSPTKVPFKLYLVVLTFQFGMDKQTKLK